MLTPIIVDLSSPSKYWDSSIGLMVETKPTPMPNMIEQISKPTIELFQKPGSKPPRVTSATPSRTSCFLEMCMAICPAIREMIKEPRPGRVDSS